VPEATLNARLKGRKSPTETRTNNYKLPITEMETLGHKLPNV
jgi:hypothetical protein